VADRFSEDAMVDGYERVWVDVASAAGGRR
jgi:hypothetical protein